MREDVQSDCWRRLYDKAALREYGGGKYTERGGGILYIGHPNELWIYGSEAFDIMKQQLGQRERKVYLPAGTWKHIADNKIYEGGQTILCPAPLGQIPVFIRQN